MIDNIKCSFIIWERYLLKEQGKFGFDFFCFVEEIELVLLLFGDKFGNNLLKLLWTSFKWEFIGAKGLILIVEEVDQDILR